MDRHAAMQIFVKVAELHSFTKAAQLLGIPKATASTAIQDLEALVQAKLFNRTTRTVELTAEGVSYLERCRDLLSDMEDMESMFQVASAQITGKIRVDMPSSLAREVVIPNLPSFLALHPQLEIEMVGADRKVDLIREGIDCTIRGGEIEAGLGAIDINLGRQVKIVNIVSASYIKRHGEPKDLGDLANHRLVHYVQDFGQKPCGFEYWDGEETHEIKMQSNITVSSIDGYKAACLAGLGICQNPRIGVLQYLKSGELVEVLTAFRPRPQGGTGRIVYPQRRFLAKRVRAFIEWVQPLLKQYFEGQDACIIQQRLRTGRVALFHVQLRSPTPQRIDRRRRCRLPQKDLPTQATARHGISRASAHPGNQRILGIQMFPRVAHPHRMQ